MQGLWGLVKGAVGLTNSENPSYGESKEHEKEN